MINYVFNFNYSVFNENVTFLPILRNARQENFGATAKGNRTDSNRILIF
jgi:hypothetical protein